jgi:hypothetical protein
MRTVTNFRIDKDIRRDFHIWCIENDTTIAENLRSHIDNTLGRRDIRPAQTNSWFSSQGDNESGLSDRWEESY